MSEKSIMGFRIEGEDMEKKEVARHSDSAGHVFVPKEWIGRKVAIVLLPEGSDENAD